jgi:hypothetical protein
VGGCSGCGSWKITGIWIIDFFIHQLDVKVSNNDVSDDKDIERSVSKAFKLI